MRRLIRLSLLLVLAAFGCENDENQSQVSQPTITAFTAPELSRGQKNIVASILGTNLNGVTAISMGDGITVKTFSNVSANEVAVTLDVSEQTAPGPRTIMVVTAGATVTAPGLVSVGNNRAPVARFSVDPPSGSTGTVFSFDASTSSDQDGQIVSYSWDFGGAGTDRGKKVTKKFNTTDDFEVSLKVRDDDGAESRQIKTVKVAKNSPPVARFTLSPGSGSTITAFTFNASNSEDPDGRINSYKWKFGDGKSGSGEVASHTYAKEGTFRAVLTVTDNKGQDGSAEKEVKVEKGKGSVCHASNVHKGPAHVFDVVSADRASRTIHARFRGGNPGCRPFTKCGDIRIGGYPGVSPGDEKWIGVMCKFIDLGNGEALITVDGGHYWPTNGQRNLYTWPQECNIPGICRGN